MPDKQRKEHGSKTQNQNGSKRRDMHIITAKRAILLNNSSKWAMMKNCSGKNGMYSGHTIRTAPHPLNPKTLKPYPKP